MLFLGTTFLGARYTLDPSPTRAKNVSDIKISSGTFDQLFVTKNPNLTVKNGYDDWDFDTVLNADFENGLDAGNSGFSLNNTDTVIIKCREVGTYDWITIYTKDIEKVEDFKININDYYRPSNKDYEYMVVSVCNGIENTYVSKTVTSEFNGLYVCDKDHIYGTLLNMDYLDTSRNVVSSTLEMKNNKYASVVSNNIIDYEQGVATADFIQFDQDEQEINISGSVQYRNDIKSFLNNKRPKILKFHDGRIWLVSITDTISDSGNDDDYVRQLSFNWVEIGNPNDMKTLYMNGLSDVGKEWWY